MVPRVVDQYLECGRPEGGFARIRCPSCRREHLLAFSCQTRNFCPSCQAKRGALFGERLIEEILDDVPHRHVTFTIPKALRGLFERERKLLKILARSAHRAMETMLREAVGNRRVRVGTVASIQTFGSFGANFHPHLHALVTEGVFHSLGAKVLFFEQVEWWDRGAVAQVFRELVFSELIAAKRLRPETAEMMRSWNHSGFNVHAGEPVLPTDKERLEHLARYVTRAPLALDRLELLADDRVRVRTPVHPQTGATRMELDVYEMIRRLCAQIPDPRQHMVTYYGWYSHRARGERRKAAATEGSSASEVEVRTSTARGRSWARLMRRIFEVDPLLCPQCQVEMQIVSVIQEVTVVDRLLAHLRKIGGNDPHEGTAQRGPPGGTRALPDVDG